MLSYKEDPTLPDQTIVLYNGETEYRALCTKILGDYYVKNKDCFELESEGKTKWFRVSSGYILKDYETNKWFFKTEVYKKIYGIVAFENKVPILGHYTPNPYNNVSKVEKDLTSTHAINSEILLENGYIEDVSTGKWRILENLTSYRLQEVKNLQNMVNYGNQGYNIEDNLEESILKKKYYDEYNVPISTDIRKYSRFLNDVSFGIEIECSKGFVPDYLQNRTGLVVCHDGSLKDERGTLGPEYTTIPLGGAKGLQNIVNISKFLKNRTVLSPKCSLHLHLGNLPTSRLFLISLYILSYKIQDELFKMFPYYKSDFKQAKDLLHKEKDYCQKLKKMNMGILKSSTKESYETYINENYKKLFYWLSQDDKGSGFLPSIDCNRKHNRHPIPAKWNRKNRYYWMNLMNTMFSERNTVEFRLHTPTVNSQKIINWLFICNAIVRYALLNSKDILTSTKKIALNDVLDYYRNVFRTSSANFLSDYLKAYVKERTEAFAKDYSKNDYLSNWELEGDKEYSFTYGEITNLF